MNYPRLIIWEHSGSVVECLTRDRGAVGSSLTGVTALCPWPIHINPSLVLVQPRKTRPYINKRLLMRGKESNQTKPGSLYQAEWKHSLVYKGLTLYLLVASTDNLQTVLTQIRSDKMLGLIWIQSVWHSNCIPERIFWKSWFWKNQLTKKDEKFLRGQRVKNLGWFTSTRIWYYGIFFFRFRVRGR